MHLEHGIFRSRKRTLSIENEREQIDMIHRRHLVRTTTVAPRKIISIFKKSPKHPKSSILFLASIVLLSLFSFHNSRQNLLEQLPISTEEDKCPLAIRKNIGIYSEKARKNGKDPDNSFRNVVLVTSSNSAYTKFLKNWEYLANELGLQWVVLALDNFLYFELGVEKAVKPGSDSVMGVGLFRSTRFNKMSCNKLKRVLDIVNDCDVDVVFSDADNIFYHDPFEHDLGRLIKAQRYDYVYQSNEHEPNVQHGQDSCLQGHPRPEANTGFYYFSRKSEWLKQAFEETLEKCNNPDNHLDDQALFWKTFWELTKVNPMGISHCEYDEYLEPTKHNLDQVQSKTNFNFCCPDPYHYPTGNGQTTFNPDPITYHANFAYTHQEKIQKINDSRADHYGWDPARYGGSDEGPQVQLKPLTRTRTKVKKTTKRRQPNLDIAALEEMERKLTT